MKIHIMLLMTSLIFVSCNVISGNGNVVNEKRHISNIHMVRTSGSIDVDIHNGDSFLLSAEDDENLLPYLVTEVHDGVLSIHYKSGYNISNDHAKVIVTAPALEKIITSGSGDINSNGIIKSNSGIEIDLSGSGNVNAGVDAPSIEVSGSGSGNLSLTGRTKDFDCKVSGSGDVNCGNLHSENTRITISGSGNATVFTSIHLIARTSGSGNIFYSGNPEAPEIHTSGSGTVQPRK